MGSRLLELVIEEVRMGEVPFDEYWVIGLEAPWLSRKRRLVFHLLNRFLIGRGLLRGQLNDSDTRRQQKREYQPTRFHIGKLIGFQHAFIWSSARIGGQKHVAK